MGRTTDADVITSVSTVRTCTRASSASPWMDSAPCWFIWAWLADSTGTTGTAPAGTTTGTGRTQGTASPSPVAWKENDINLSSSRLESRPFSTANSSELVVSSCASSSSFASSASGSGTGSGSALALHGFNFLILDSEQQKHQLRRCGTPSSTTSDTTDHRPNETATNTASTCRSASAFNSFLLCSPSTLNSEVDIENKHHLVGIHDPFPRIRQRSRTPKMPGSTLSAPDQPRFPNSTYSAANITANPSQWRPHTSRSGRSARSASPLFARWARRHHQQLDVHGSNDSRSSTERKSTSSNGNGNSLNSDDASHKHTYNFSTSTMTRSSSSSRRQSQSALPPPLTREEFEALPLAIQRKYFSTLERLRFAQASGIDDISQHYDQITARNFKRRLARQDRSASENHVNLRRRSVLESRFSSADSLAFASLPEKIKKRHFTREEQSVLTRQLRASVILDAADEVVYKVGRRASRHLNVPQDMDLVAPSFPQQRNNSMDSLGTNRHVADESRGANFPESFYDTFRWLDEEDDLDLRLFLDDYHANLREHVPEPSKQRRPSFRRHLSISKIPFGRTSISASRPPTRDPVSSPKSHAQSPLSTSSEFHFGHQRRKSRALSLITPKHAPQDSITTIDPSPAHYQDPEARLKLRVYLASPQKFDEAIEFGFPSTDILPGSPPAANEGRTLSKRQSEHKLSDDTNLRTFLADDDDDDDDDKMSLNSDQPSVADPDSPQTPHAFDKGPVRPVRVASDQTLTHASKPSEGGYTQVPAFSREMTLRMTLTRPDLRAHEEQIYGWQKPVPQTGRKDPQMGRKSHQLTQVQDESTSNVDYFADGLRKESMEKIFAGIDATNNNTDQNVMRRIWNRVRRS